MAKANAGTVSTPQSIAPRCDSTAALQLHLLCSSNSQPCWQRIKMTSLVERYTAFCWLSGNVMSAFLIIYRRTSTIYFCFEEFEMTVAVLLLLLGQGSSHQPLLTVAQSKPFSSNTVPFPKHTHTCMHARLNFSINMFVFWWDCRNWPLAKKGPIEFVHISKTTYALFPHLCWHCRLNIVGCCNIFWGFILNFYKVIV